MAGLMSDGSAESIETKRLQLNLKVLQRHDPSIVEILDSTSYVVLYKYVSAPGPGDADSQDSPAEMQWMKTSIEGSMFIFRRSQAPFYGFFILNRHGVENFNHYLEDEANLELTPEYIIVQTDDEQIKGIWIFEAEHRGRLGEKMLELSRLSKHGTTLSKAVASVPVHPSNDNGLTSSVSHKPVPAGQSISLDMLFGSNANTNDNQSQANSGEVNLFGHAPQTGAAPASNNQQSMNLLDSLFSDLSGTAGGSTATWRPSAISAQVGSSITETSDENALRSLLGLSSTSPSYSKTSPGAYGSAQQQPLPHAALSSSVQQASLSSSQRPQQQPAVEPLAPQPQRRAQFDSFGYDAHIPPPAFTQQHLQGTGQPQSMHHQMQPQHPPPPPHLVPHYHQPPPQHRQVPPPAPGQQHYVSAPLVPLVLLNKAKTSLASPPTQPRSTVTQQPQASPSYGGPDYGTQETPQYSPGSSGFQKYGPPPMLRVKSPLSQSHTYGYASSGYSNSDVRVGAQSIPPPPVPPVESRPPHLQQAQQQPVPRRESGHRLQQALSPRTSPQSMQHQPLTPNEAMDALNDTLQKTSLYQSQNSSAVPGSYNRSAPVNRQVFREYLSNCLQDERFLESLYMRYLQGLEGR